MITSIQLQALRDAAELAMRNAYAPYSQFRVGAALRCLDGTIVTGCNVENSSYPAGGCAEFADGESHAGQTNGNSRPAKHAK